MNKIWLVAAYEYKRNVFKKSFILVLLSVPLFIVFSIGLGIVMESIQDNPLPVGYVDHAGVLIEQIASSALNPSWVEDQDVSIEFIAFLSEAEAQAALEAKEIQAYYILPFDYLETRRVELVYIKKPGENAERQFFDYLQLNLADTPSSEVAYRVATGTNVIVRSLDGRREVPSSGPPFGLLMPLFINMAFLFMLMMSSGYIMSAIADEKENRTIEVLVTTISPMQLVTGKILGTVAISLTLLVTWTLVIVLGIFIALQGGVAWFQYLNMDMGIILATIAIALPAYVLAAALMTAVGAMVTTVQEGQSLSAIFFILHFAPLYISWGFIENPHGPLATILSLLPFTSLMTIGMRNLFTIVPTWQVATSVAVQVISALGALWLAGRALRLGMLRYGQRLTWRGLFSTAYKKREIAR